MNRGIGKSAWFIIIGIIVLALLAFFGMDYWEQLKAQDELRTRIATTNQLAGKISPAELIATDSTLKSKISDAQAMTAGIQSSLKRPLDCLATTDVVYATADKAGVEIQNITSTGKSIQKIEGITFDSLAVAVKATGEQGKLMQFIKDLNNEIPTAVLSSVMLDIPETGSKDIPVANLVITINSYEGK